MPFSPQGAEHRFGYGLSPTQSAPQSVGEMLDGVRGPDVMQQLYPTASYREMQDHLVLYARFNRHAKKNAGTAAGKKSREKRREVNEQVRDLHVRWYAQVQLRRAHTAHGFRERLVAFWADHFSAQGKRVVLKSAGPLYVDDAIRPHVGGTFSELLFACVTHPLMLHYLDQNSSVGPNSKFSKRQGKGRGLNENLAREVLELHTLGVDGPYAQRDVRALAALFTGLGRNKEFGFRFRPNIVEPGPHTVLGKKYSGKISMERIKAVLRDLAMHPVTATHIAQKMAVHFVGDQPPAALVDVLRLNYLATGGDLMSLYKTLLQHPMAWQEPATNIRPPDEFVSSALRALAISPAEFAQLKPPQIRRIFLRQLFLMGQPWLKPSGPDGFSEDDAAWVTPQGIAGRLDWAMRMPNRIKSNLPDPRIFVHQALGPNPPSKVIFAANSAESHADAIGLVLMSPAFQRR